MNLKDFHPLPYTLEIRQVERGGERCFGLVAQRDLIRRIIAHIYRRRAGWYVLSVLIHEDFYSYDLEGSAEQVLEALAALLDDERLDEYLMEEVFRRV